MLDNDPELVQYRERVERRYEIRRQGLRRHGTGRRHDDAPRVARAFPLPVVLMLAGVILAGVLMFLML